jgi:hypothetical protein
LFTASNSRCGCCSVFARRRSKYATPVNGPTTPSQRRRKRPRHKRKTCELAFAAGTRLKPCR